jgi:hypothetical protein
MRQRLRILGALLLGLAIALVAFGLVIAARASAIGGMSLDAARREIEGTDKVIVVTFCQRGCMPCQAMKVTTWKDSSIVQWMQEHGVGVQVDTDLQPATARELKATATPMVVMLSDTGEIARKTGFMSAGEMAEWLDNSFTKRTR